MARDEFINNLRIASGELTPPRVWNGPDLEASGIVPFWQEDRVWSNRDLWLTPKSVEGFDPADFEDLPEKEREKLAKEVAAFLAIAREVPANARARKTQSKQACKHLEGAIKIVGGRLLNEWIAAQNKMLEVAMEAARKKEWYAEKDEKEVCEPLLGTYKAPRLRIKSIDREVVFDPVALFCGGGQGVVDLVVLPTFETAYYVVFKDNHWQIVSSRGKPNRRPFTPETFVNTITRLPRF